METKYFRVNFLVEGNDDDGYCAYASQSSPNHQSGWGQTANEAVSNLCRLLSGEFTEPFDGTHKGDPCQWCGVPHDDVEVGPCEGAKINQKPTPLTWREFVAMLVDQTKYPGQMRPWWLCTDPKLQHEMLAEAAAQFTQWKANELRADKKRKAFDTELYGGEE